MLKKIWTAWRNFGRWLGDQVARVFLVVFHFTVMLAFSLLVRLTQDPHAVLETGRASRFKMKMRPRAGPKGELKSISCWT